MVPSAQKARMLLVRTYHPADERRYLAVSKYLIKARGVLPCLLESVGRRDESALHPNFKVHFRRSLPISSAVGTPSAETRQHFSGSRVCTICRVSLWRQKILSTLEEKVLLATNPYVLVTVASF